MSEVPKVPQTTSEPDFWKAMQGIAVLAFGAFAIFGAAGFGWYAGAALIGWLVS